MESNNKHLNTALLIMDVQNAMVKRLKDSTLFFQSITKAIETARSNDIPVLYIVVGFRKGYPEISPANKSFSAIKKGVTYSLDTEEAYQVHSAVAPQPGDVIITKKRFSAFTGSDLEVVLRALGIKHMVLTGISTSGVVLSTLREAADKDYAITVLSDCCADADEEVYRVLTTKVFPRQAEILESETWVNALV